MIEQGNSVLECNEQSVEWLVGARYIRSAIDNAVARLAPGHQIRKWDPILDADRENRIALVIE